MWKTNFYNTSKVTIELRDLIKDGVNIWDFDYPSYYEGELKKAFENKVIDHYFFRQIGQETVGRFLHFFRSRIREIMPRYIDLYKTVELMHGLENPFDNVDIVETFEQLSEGEASTSGTGSSTSKGNREDTRSGSSSGSESAEKSDSKTASDNFQRKYSNTPQGSITNLDNYMTEATVETRDSSETVTSSATGSNENTSNETSTSEEESEITSTESRQNTESGRVTHTLTRKGNQGVNTYAHDIIEFRQSIIDVDMMIIRDLNDLFLGVY